MSGNMTTDKKGSDGDPGPKRENDRYTALEQKTLLGDDAVGMPRHRRVVRQQSRGDVQVVTRSGRRSSLYTSLCDTGATAKRYIELKPAMRRADELHRPCRNRVYSGGVLRTTKWVNFQCEI
jgi:hypothetical protein